MTSIEKKLRALANGKDLPWDQTKALLERLTIKSQEVGKKKFPYR